MLYYAVMYCIIGLYCAFDVRKNGQQGHGYYSLLAIIVIFVGYRYNIGYDWLAYELLFDTTNSNFSWNQYSWGATTLQVEPLFYGLVLLCRWVGVDFQHFLMLISIINLVVIHRAVQRIDGRYIPLFWLVYFIVAMVGIQFNIIRQALASSFVILALLAAHDRKMIRAIVLVAVGISIHISTFAFVPFVFFGFRRLPLFPVAVVGIVSLGAFFAENAIGQILGFLSAYLPSMFSEKAEGYSNFLSGDNTGISPLSLLLIFGHAAAAIVVRKSDRDRWDHLAFNMSLLMLVCHIAFYNFPSMWLRFLAVAVVFQVPVVLRDVQRMFGFGAIRLASAATFAVSLAMLYPLVTRPENIAFVPYHNYLQYVLFNDPGDGRQRSEYAIRRAESLSGE